MADAANPFEVVQAMMLQNLGKVQYATQSYIDTVEKAMRGTPGANEIKSPLSGHTLSEKLQQTVFLRKSFCVQKIFTRSSAFRSSTFSLN